MPKLSVIIPVYNTEKYLGKCLDSVCNQTLSDIEVICINDCSTDNSLNILRDYAQKDSRIKIIDFKENKGAAIARNLGIDEANGEYIAFLDSDDYPETSEFYEKLYLKAKETGADVVKGAYKNSDAISEDKSINEKIKEDKNNFCSTYCSAIFNLNLIKENNIRFPELRDMEDPVFAFNCALKANAVEVVDNLNLIVTQRNDSITKLPITVKQVKDKLEGLKIIFNLSQISNQPYVLSYWFTTVITDSLKANNPEINELLEKTCWELYALKKNDMKFIENLNCLVSSCDSSVFNFVHNLLIKVIKNEIEKHEVISFDIFDTLLLRPFLEPTDLFEYMGVMNHTPKFLKDRIMAERATRLSLKVKRSSLEDIKYKDIYKRLQVKYPWAENLELDIERQTLQANRDMLDIFNYAKEKGKTIIIVSDMYLSSEFLTKVLNEKGYSGFSKLYVSSKIGVCKGSGKIYDYVINDLGMVPNQILHIGDNIVADVKKPLEKGISSVYYPQIKSKIIQKQILFYSPGDKIAPFPLKIITGLYTLLEHQNLLKYEGWSGLAYKYGGILLYVYISIVKKISDMRKLTDLIFVARDGYLMKKAFELLFPDYSAKCHYVYASRKLSSLYMDKQISDDNEYYKYVQSLEFEGDKIGIVDTCAGEFSAQRLLQKYLGKKDYIGIYLASFMNYEFNYINLTGYRHSFEEIGFSWDLIETLLSSPEPPIEDMKDCKPIYRENLNQADKINVTISSQIEKGIMDFIKDAKNLYGDYNIVFQEYNMKDIFDYFKYTWNNMDQETMNLLAQVEHPVDGAQTKYINLLSFKNANKDAELLGV